MADLPDLAPEQPQYLTIGDFAKLAELSPRTVRRLITGGQLPAMVDDQRTLSPYQPGQLLPPAFRYVVDAAQVEEAQRLAVEPSPRASRQVESSVAPQVAQAAQEAQQAEVARLQAQVAEQAAILADRDAQLLSLRAREASLEATATAQAGEIQRLMLITERLLPLLPPIPPRQAPSPPPAEPARKRRRFLGFLGRRREEVQA
jgi:hypothetical protein